jgi:cytochrome c oxidase subunit 2
VFKSRYWLSLFALSVVACAGDFPQSTFHPASDFAGALDGLFRGIFWWALAVFVVVEGLLLVAILRFRARPGAPPPSQVHGHTALEIGWTIAPALILVFLAVPTIRVIFRSTGEAAPGALRVEVIGHQWWWEFRYPELGITTANEMRVPVGRPVALEMTTADVIHSFWVPRLAGKRDVIAGRVNRLAFTPESVGTFLGQCAEYCGESHANMRVRVMVETDAVFQAWAAREGAAPAPLDSASAAWRGRQVFARSACIGCHTMEDVPAARAQIGPNLSHVGGRTTIAAGLFPNDTDHLRRWVANAPAMKPGALMPPMVLSDEDLDAIVAYLQSRQ